MASEPEVTRRELQRQVLLARCELDRQELRAELVALQSRWQEGVHRLERASPWLLLAAPVAGLLLGGAWRGGKLGRLTSIATLVLETRKYWPLLRSFFQPRPSASSSSPPRP